MLRSKVFRNAGAFYIKRCLLKGCSDMYSLTIAAKLINNLLLKVFRAIKERL